MTIYIDKVYLITIKVYPWTDAYANTYSTIASTMLKENQARQFLDAQGIKITEPSPIQSSYHQGDKGLKCKWVKGTLVSGPLQGSTVAILEDWLQLTSSTYKTPTPITTSCICPTDLLIAQGCKCGGN